MSWDKAAYTRGDVYERHMDFFYDVLGDMSDDEEEQIMDGLIECIPEALGNYLDEYGVHHEIADRILQQRDNAQDIAAEEQRLNIRDGWKF